MISDLIMICGVSGVLSPGQMESLAGRIVQLEVKELKAELARLGVDCSAMGTVVSREDVDTSSWSARAHFR